VVFNGFARVAVTQGSGDIPPHKPGLTEYLDNPDGAEVFAVVVFDQVIGHGDSPLVEM